MIAFLEQQPRKWASERKVKAEEAAPAQRRVLLTARETSVAALDDENDVNSCLHVVKERTYS